MNIPIWTGISTFESGQTPFGFYDSDTDFQTDADNPRSYTCIGPISPLRAN